MALPATRIGDKDLVHCSVPTRIQGAKTVFVNGRPWSCFTHINDPHLKPNPAPPPPCIMHTKPIAKGSSTVFVEKLGAGRVTDPVLECTAVATGSTDVFAGG
jgi:uncharacterized Zn-binding protein involved in type VI secretion